MKIAIKNSPIGKPEITQGGAHTYGWQTANLSQQQLVKHAAQDGKPLAVGVYKEGHRAKENFISSDVIIIDVDKGANPNGLTEKELQQFLASEVVSNDAFAVVETFNSKPGAYRLRVYFQFDHRVTNAGDYRDLVAALQKMIPFADTAAKDAARAFYGSRPGTVPLYTNWGALLLIAPLMALVRQERQQREAEHAQAAQLAASTPDLEEVRRALSFIPPITNYETWVKVIAAVWSAYPGGDGIALIEQWSPGKPNEVESKFKAGFDGSINLGSLFHLARGYGYRKPRRTLQRFAKPENEPRKRHTLADKISPFEIAGLTNAVYINAQYVTLADLPSGDLALRSPMGTGKTELINRWQAAFEAQHGRKPSLLVLGHREALARNQADRLGVTCYKSLDDAQIPHAERLAITIHSLHKVRRKDGSLRHFDLVVIDETTQVLRAFGDQETWQHSSPLDAFSTLQDVSRAAGAVWLLDAYLDDIAVNWLTQARGKPPSTIQNDYRKPKPPLTLYATKEAAILKAEKLLKAGKRIAMPFGSKEMLEVVQQRLGEVISPALIQVVHSGNSMSSGVQDFTAHINEAALNIQCLMYTSSYGSGIDITAPFNAVVGIFGRHMTAEEIMQMIGRVRNTDEVHIYVTPTTEGIAETDPDKLYSQQQAKTLSTAAAIGIEKPSIRQEQRNLSQLLATFEGEDNRQQNNLLSAVAAYLKGDSTFHFDETRAERTKADLQNRSEGLKEAQSLARQTATPVDHMEYEHHRRHGTLDDTIRAGHARWIIEECVGIPITQQIDDDLHKSADRAKLKVLTLVRSDPQHAQKLDQRDYDDNTLLKHRRHFSPHRRIVLDLLEAAFGVKRPDDLLRLDLTSLTADDLIERTQTHLEAHQDAIRLYIDQRGDLSKDPLAMLRRVLGKAGIRLDYTRKRIDGKRVYTYFVDKQALARWLSYSDSRIAHLEQKEAERAAVPVGVSQNAVAKKVISRDLGQLTLPTPPQGRFWRISAEISATWDSLTRAEKHKLAGIG